MIDEKYEAFRYMKGRSVIESTLKNVPQQKQAAFIYECISYMSDHPGTLVPLVFEINYKLWQQYGRL